MRPAYLASKAPETRTKPKINAKNVAKRALVAMASELSKLIDGTASVTEEQRLELGLSVRATPTPTPDPGTATDFKVAISVNGDLDVSFKCKNPVGSRGTVYQIWRRVGATGPYTYLCGVGSKKFTDSTIPAGATQLAYQVQAVRSTAVGGWAQCDVNFGAAPSGAMTASVTETAPKLAA
jgi:hypothetical protein